MGVLQNMGGAGHSMLHPSFTMFRYPVIFNNAYWECAWAELFPHKTYLVDFSSV